MKYFQFVCLFICSTLSYDASAMLSKDKLDGDTLNERAELNKFLNANFIQNENGFWIPPQHKTQPVEIEKFIESFPDDNTIKIAYAECLFNKNPGDEKGLSLCAQVIMAENCYNSQYINTVLSNSKFFSYVQNLYLNQLRKSFPDTTYHINDIVAYVNNPQHNILKGYKDNNQIIRGTLSREKDKKITKGSLQEAGIRKLILDQFTPILIALNKKKDPIYFDAFFVSIIDHHSFEMGDSLDLLPNLTHKLYDSFDKDNLPIPHSLKMAYAKHYFFKNKDCKRAIDLCKMVLGDQEDSDNYFQSQENYSILGAHFLMQEDYQQARQAFTQAWGLSGNNDLRVQWNLAYANMRCGNFDENHLKLMKKIYDMPSEDKKRNGIPSSVVRHSYLFTLEQAGKQEEVTTFLLAEQQRALEKASKKNIKYGNLLKTFCAAEIKKKEEQEKQDKERRQVINSSKANQVNMQPTALTVYSNQNSPISEKESKDIAKLTTIRKKKKTKGVPNQGMTPLQPMHKQPERMSRSSISIKTLTNNSNAIATFHDLFTLHPKGKCFNNQVNISLSSVNLLFKALHQQTDTGKGSHKKATLNFQSAGSSMEDQMIILTNTTYVKDYQIKQIREAFVKAGIWPDDAQVIEVLRTDFPDLMYQ